MRERAHRCEHVFVSDVRSTATILHADLDSFYASVEQRDDPSLRGKPVVVGGGVVLAASYEAKAFGVSTGTPVYEARKNCPDIVLIQARPARYVEVHHQLMDAIGDCIPHDKPGSIDEVPCWLIGRERNREVPDEVAQFIAEHIEENVRELEGVTRQEMDEFGAASQQRAVAAIKRGHFENEITPLTLPDGTEVSTDDGPRDGTTAEKLAALKPVFRPDGEITAGNACPLNDGAAAVMVMSDTKAAQLGLKPLARIIASGVTGLNPEIMGLGPIEACRQAMARAGMTADDIDLVEINEAFAAQVIPSARHLGFGLDKVNINGGAIALGHPFGMTGARIMTTLINNLQSEDKTIGIESMCVGGGQGMAMIIERLN